MLNDGIGIANGLMTTIHSCTNDGTRMLATAIAQSSAFSIAGGGDTVAAIKTLPAIAALESRAT